MNEISIARIRHCLKKLEDPSTKQSDRLAYCRQIISAGHDAHDEELRQMNDIKSTKADPALEAPIA